MIRSLFLRTAAVVASLLFLAPVAMAQFNPSGIRGSKSLSGMDLTRARVWVDQTCTDAFNTPATTTNINLTTVANWDTVLEPINPDKNIGDAVQTSGSADGWCDTTPWVIKGTFTMGASQTLWLGPFYNVPKQGFVMNWDFDAIITNYQWLFAYRTGLNNGVNGVQFLGGQTASTTLGPIQAEIAPVNAAPSTWATFDNFYFVQGRPMYLRLATTGAGVFTFGLETLPILPFYEEQ